MYKIKTLTANNRLCNTTVNLLRDKNKKPESEIVSISQRILATKQDITDGYFSNSKTIYETKNYILREVHIVFFRESFEAIKRGVELLSQPKQGKLF